MVKQKTIRLIGVFDSYSLIIQFNGFETDGVLVKGETMIIPDGEEVVVPVVSGVALHKRVKGANGPAYVGYYIRPIPAGVGHKSQGLHGYNGIDLAAPAGTPIMAAASGRVIVSKSNGWNGGYANYVVIEHPNKTQTLYAHNSRNAVAVSQQVVQGQVIGTAFRLL